jgi:hypothetical protein
VLSLESGWIEADMSALMSLIAVEQTTGNPITARVVRALPGFVDAERADT